MRSAAAAPTLGGICENDPSACPRQEDLKAAAGKRLHAEVYAVQQSGPRSGVRALGHSVTKSLFQVASPGAPSIGGFANVSVAPGEARAAGDRIELEAQFAVAVSDPRDAARRLRGLVASFGGAISRDEEQVGDRETRVEMLVRVPATAFEAFAARIPEIGRVEQRVVRTVDAGLEERDLDAIVSNLQDALARYKALLASATTPADTLAAEREIERASSDLDRVRARLAWLRDRIARATVVIALAAPGPPREESVEVPFLMAGVRPLALFDIADAGTGAFLGGGITLRLPHAAGDSGRGLSLDVDVVRACCGTHPDRSDKGFMILGGWDLTPSSAESRARRWFLPFIGARAGFSQLRDRPDFVVAAVGGVDVLRTGSVALGAQGRLMLLVGNPDGPHAAIEPALTADIGF